MRFFVGTLTVLVALAVAAPASALDAPAIIAAAAPADAFPDDDVVVLYRDEMVTVSDDGRLTRRIHTLQRLQTQWAMRNRSDVRVAWDSARQDLEVIASRTYMRDGTVVPTPDNGFNEVTPGAVARAAVFMNWREMVISHVGTEPGCVVELEYVLSDRVPGALPPSGVTWYGLEHPVLESRFTGIGVEALAVHADPEFGAEAGSTWILRDLPAYRDEGPLEQRRRFVPHVVWGKLTGPEDLADALRGRNQAAAAGPSPDLAVWLAEVRGDPAVLTEGDLVQRIAALVHDGTAAVRLPGDPWATAPRPVSEVLATAVGTDWERALLGLALLREAGWQPEIGVFGQAPLADGLIVAADRFATLRVVVRVGDGNWWLAPERAEAWTDSGELAGWTGLFLAADGGQRVYKVPVRSGSCRWSAHLRADPDGDGWTATADLVLQGPYRPRGQDARDLAEGLAGRLLPEGELADLDVREDSPQTLSLRMTARGEAFGEADGDLLIRDLPWPDTSVLAHLPAGFHAERPLRQSPLWVETPGHEQVSLRIDLPAGWRLDVPTGFAQDLSVPAASFQLELREQDGAVIIERTLELAAVRVSPAEYPTLREVLAAAVAVDRRPAVFVGHDSAEPR